MMNPIRRFVQRARASLAGPGAWQIWSPTSGGVSGKLATLPGLSTPASSVLWVYACVMARSEAIMQARLRLSNAAGDIIESGPLYELLRRPNPIQDGVQFLGLLESYLTVYNAAFVVPVGEGALPDELVALHPQYVRAIEAMHKPTGAKTIAGWEYSDPTTGAVQRFLLGEIIPVVTLNPHNPLQALSPMSALARSLCMDIATREQNLALFLNGGLPDFALVTEKNWEPEQAKTFLQRFLDNYSGYGNAHKPALLYNGVKIETIGLKPEELQSLDVLRTMTPQEICAGLRTKPVMANLLVGETGLSQGTSTNEQKVAWWSETGNSECMRIASALQRGLVDRFPWPSARGRRATCCERLARAQFARASVSSVASVSGLTVWFDNSEVPELVQQRWSRTDQLSKLLGMGWRPDEAAEYLNMALPPHPDNMGRVAFSLATIGEGAEPATEPPRTQPHEPPASMQSIASVFSRISAAMSRSAGTAVPPRFASNHAAFHRFLEGKIKQARKRWSRYFVEQRGRVLERVASVRGAETRADAESLLARLFPRRGEDNALVARLGALWESNLRDGWEYFAQESGADPKAHPFAVDDPRVQKAIEGRKVQGLKVNDTTEGDLRDIISKALQAGDTMAQLSDSIAGYYRDRCVGDDAVRPETAARTQVAGTVNEGRLLAAQDVGGLLKVWLHGSPQEPREAHVAAMAKYTAAPIALAEKFEVNGHECDAPGDADLPVEETANCTCMVAFVPAKE